MLNEGRYLQHNIVTYYKKESSMTLLCEDLEWRRVGAGRVLMYPDPDPKIPELPWPRPETWPVNKNLSLSCPFRVTGLTAPP